MKDVVVIGAGKIGATVAGLLASTDDYQVTLADRSPEVLGNLDREERIRLVAVDVEDSLKLVDLLNGQFAVLNAAPFRLTKHIAEAARAAGTHYLDLTEDVVSTRRVRELAANANTAFIPQCGLAPGFVSIVAFDLAKGFEVLDSVRLRVGALPQYPSNALNYNLTWSTDGVINEYCEACEAIVNGLRREVPPLEEREEFSLDGVTYEAFNTSGGVGTLCDTLEGKVRTLNYRTIRYPGHAAIMRALLNDLRLQDRRDVLKDILEHAVPTTLQDVVIIFVTVSGHKKGHLVQETYARMMMAVSLRQHLDRHAEIAGSFPSIGTLLHQPCRGRVAERVGCHVWPKASVFDRRSESFLIALTGLPYHSTQKRCPRLFQRRRWPKSSGGKGMGG